MYQRDQRLVAWLRFVGSASLGSLLQAPRCRPRCHVSLFSPSREVTPSWKVEAIRPAYLNKLEWLKLYESFLSRDVLSDEMKCQAFNSSYRNSPQLPRQPLLLPQSCFFQASALFLFSPALVFALSTKLSNLPLPANDRNNSTQNGR